MADFVIIPAYNEEQHIAEVVRGALTYVSPVVVVDDGSRDRTAEKAEAAGAHVLRHKVNLGKGAALKTGCDYALAQGAQRLVVMDADGQHNPEKIPQFLAALGNGGIVFGARAVPRTMPKVLLFGNKFMSFLLRTLYDISLHDSQCGYRAFTAEAYPLLRWGALNYYVETEMAIRAGRASLQYAEVPIETIYKDNYKGTTIIDGMGIVAKMIGERMVSGKGSG